MLVYGQDLPSNGLHHKMTRFGPGRDEGPLPQTVSICRYFTLGLTVSTQRILQAPIKGCKFACEHS